MGSYPVCPKMYFVEAFRAQFLHGYLSIHFFKKERCICNGNILALVLGGFLEYTTIGDDFNGQLSRQLTQSSHGVRVGHGSEKRGVVIAVQVLKVSAVLGFGITRLPFSFQGRGKLNK